MTDFDVIRTALTRLWNFEAHPMAELRQAYEDAQAALTRIETESGALVARLRDANDTWRRQQLKADAAEKERDEARQAFVRALAEGLRSGEGT